MIINFYLDLLLQKRRENNFQTLKSRGFCFEFDGGKFIVEKLKYIFCKKNQANTNKLQIIH